MIFNDIVLCVVSSIEFRCRINRSLYIESFVTLKTWINKIAFITKLYYITYIVIYAVYYIL